MVSYKLDEDGQAVTIEVFVYDPHQQLVRKNTRFWNAGGLDVAVGVIAEYLNRVEIVINLDNTVYQLAEFNQWAEPLSNNLTRVLEENLTNLLQDCLIEVFLASERSIPFDYWLEVDVLVLDGNLGDQVTLVAQWALLKAEEDELIKMRRSEYQEPATDNTYKRLVLAKSRTIEKLSRDIAASIKKSLTDVSKQSKE